MGTGLVQLQISSFTIPYYDHHNYYTQQFSNNNNTQTMYTKHGRSRFTDGRCRRDSGKILVSRQRSRFSSDYVTDDYDDGEFEFRSSAKQRTWWSDDDCYEDDNDEDDGFGILEGSICLNWINKLFRAFGWMLPAILISVLMGTGPNTIVMAVAVPLAQSALSLLTEALLGRSSDRLRPKTRSRKRPFARATSNTRTRRKKETNGQNRKESGDYRSWVAANDGPAKTGKGNSYDFGGWDELDKQAQEEKVGNMTPREKASGPRLEEQVEMIHRTKGDTPLLVRLLIAAFPFLGFWTKFL